MQNNNPSDVMEPTNRFSCGRFDKIICSLGIVTE